MRHGGVHSLLHTTLDVNGAGTGGHAAETFAVDSLSKHGRGGGTVTGHVAGLAGGFANHLGAHVFVRALELDLFGHGYTIFGGGGGAEFLVNEDVTTFGAERHLHGLGQFFHTPKDVLAGLFVKYELFG